MGSGYRANGQSRRANRAYVDHDVFEGLPVRHWRREPVTVAPPAEPITNENEKHDIWADELPHGMPKDYHLLPKHSQELLKAARSLKVSKRPAPEATNTKEVFTARAWKQIPRHLEGPDVEYLAKRRKGLITVTSKPAPASSGTTWNKATVRRTDAAGNMYVQDVVFAEGEQVEGEVISQSIIQDTSAVATGATPLSAAKVAPPRRRHPPPKRKAKGPGRGRKKKAASTSAPGSQLNGETTEGDEKPDTQAGETPLKDEDTEMADDSVMASDNEDGGDDDEGPEDGEDGDEPASPIAEKASSDGQDQTPIPKISADIDMTGTDMASSSLHIPGQADPTDARAGSPLKTVESAASLETKGENSPENTTIKTEASPLDVNQDAPPQPTADVRESSTQETSTLPAADAPPPPPDAIQIIKQSSPKAEGEEREAMLLDTVTNDTNDSAPATQEEIPVRTSDVITTEPTVSESVEQTNEEAPATGEDDFPDLLSGLEKKLEGDAEAVAKAANAVSSVPAEESTKEA